MRALLLVAMGFIVAPSALADVSVARDLLQRCTDLAPEDAVGFEALEEACPGVYDALTELAFAEQLCEGCDTTVDAAALTDLLVLHDRYVATSTPGVAPDPATVGAVL